MGLTCWIVRLFQPFFWDTGNPCYISTNTKKVWQNQNLFPRWALQVWGNQPSLFPPVLPHFFLGYPNNHPRRSVSCQHFDGLDLRWPTWSCCRKEVCWDVGRIGLRTKYFQLNIWLIFVLRKFLTNSDFTKVKIWRTPCAKLLFESFPGFAMKATLKHHKSRWILHLKVIFKTIPQKGCMNLANPVVWLNFLKFTNVDFTKVNMGSPCAKVPFESCSI